MIFVEKVHAKNIYLFSRMAGILEPICYICEQVGVYIFIVYFSIWEGGGRGRGGGNDSAVLESMFFYSP